MIAVPASERAAAAAYDQWRADKPGQRPYLALPDHRREVWRRIADAAIAAAERIAAHHA